MLSPNRLTGLKLYRRKLRADGRDTDIRHYRGRTIHQGLGHDKVRCLRQNGMRPSNSP